MAIYRANPPTRDFTVSANGWARDPNLSGKAKGYLLYIASHAPNYNLTFEQIVAEMADGPAAVRAGLAELESKGYLKRPRRRNADGTLGAYDWHVIDYPHVSAGHNQVAKTESGSDQGKDDVSAGGNHTRKPQPGSDQGKRDVSAGHDQTSKPQPGRDQPKQGVSAGRDQTRKSNPKKTKNLNEENEKNPTPPSPADTTGPSESNPREEEEKIPSIEDQINNIVDTVANIRPAWSRKKITEAIRDALDDHRTIDHIAEVFPKLAADTTTQYPGRLAQGGPWWEVDQQASPVPLQSDPDARCNKHPRQVANSCGPCASERASGPRCTIHPGYMAQTCGGCRADRLADDNVRNGQRRQLSAATQRAEDAFARAARYDQQDRQGRRAYTNPPPEAYESWESPQPRELESEAAA